MRLFILLLGMFSLMTAYAEPDNTCWSDPINISSVSLADADLPSNKKGGEVGVWFDVGSKAPAICNIMTTAYYYMVHYIDMGRTLPPSEINSGYFKLSDDFDIRIRSGAYYFPLLNPGFSLSSIPPVGKEMKVDRLGFRAGAGFIYLKLRRDIIGGAVMVPPDTELFSIYEVLRTSLSPPKPSKPVMQARTLAGGEIIPVMSECSINQGETINVNFNTLQTDQVPNSSNGKRYTKNIALHFSCNSSLTQDLQVQLVAGRTEFSADLIRSDNNQLGFALKHNEQLVKPMNSFGIRLVNGAGSDEITLMPVKDPKSALSAGAFNASATLVIMSL